MEKTGTSKSDSVGDSKQAKQEVLCEEPLKLSPVNGDSYKMLAAIKEDCERINMELMGLRRSADGAASQSMGLVEKTTVRELLEQICGQINMLNPDFKGVNAEGMYKYFPATAELLPKIEFGAAQSTGDRIRSATDAEEQTYVLQEIIESMIDGTSELSDGASIVGSTVASILQSITYTYGLVVKIANYLEVDLEELEHNMPAGSSLDLPQVIGARTVEALRFSAPNSWMNGQFSYRIQEANLRLVISLQQNTNYVAVALAPVGLPAGNNTFVFEGANNANVWKTGSDKRWVTWSKDPISMVLQNRDTMVRVIFVGGAKATIEVVVLQGKSNKFGKSRNKLLEYRLKLGKELSPLFHKPKCLESVVNGKTIYGKTIPGISEYILESFGYILEMVNLLHVSLNEPACYIENGQQPIVKPEMVSGGSREVLVVKMDNSGKGKGGLVTFRIGTTDLRIAIAFQLFNNGNKFGAAFYPTNIPTDANLMLYLTSDNQWSTSPEQKFAMAKDGDIVIQTRNVRARVAMTGGMKAVLSLVIKTF